MQAELKMKENQVIDLQEALKTQQAETSKAKEELASAWLSMASASNYNFIIIGQTGPLAQYASFCSFDQS